MTDDTGWVPAFTGFEAGGGTCGGIVGGYPKDSDYGTRQQRSITYRNGDVVTRLRGSVTLLVHRDSDGHPDSPTPELEDVPVTGPVTRVDYASGAVYQYRRAPGVIAVHTSNHATGPEQAAFVKAGLPSVYLLRTGSFTEYLAPDAPLVKIAKVRSTRLANVCDLIGESEWRDATVLIYGTSGIGAPIYPAG